MADTLHGSLRPERTCFDVHYYHLNITIDTAAKSISGYNEILFSAVESVDRIQLDLFANMVIDSIVFRKFHLDFKRQFNAVFVDFPGTILQGNIESIKVYYHGVPRAAKRAPWDGGFVWRTDKNGKPLIGVACEGDGASLWWPCKDELGDEPDSVRITGTTPEGLKFISNGKQESQVGSTSTWKVSYPINNYNVTFYVGDYVHFGEYYVSGKDSMPCDYYVLPYSLDKAKEQFKQVKPMLKIYEDFYGRYPFWNDGYALVESSYLGMEHQGAIAYGNRYLPGYRGHIDSSMAALGINFDYIIIHETAHEYWGNNVSVKDMADLWIHEAFATYTEALYVEKMYGYEQSLKYLETLKPGIENDKPIIGDYGVYKMGSSDMYPKGAWMLHTIRNIVNNDSLWFACLKGIQEEFKIKTVTGKEVMEYIQKVLGRDLKPVFKYYLEKKEFQSFIINYERKGCRYYLFPILSSELNLILPLRYSIDSGITWNDYPVQIVGLNSLMLTKKQFKALQFNNHLYLYDVKLEKMK